MVFFQPGAKPGGNRPSQKPNILLEKNDAISEGSLKVTKFPQIVKNSIFLMNVDENFSKFSSYLRFSSKRAKDFRMVC